MDVKQAQLKTIERVRLIVVNMPSYGLLPSGSETISKTALYAALDMLAGAIAHD